MEEGKKIFSFRGGIYRFNTYVGDFIAETMAPTEAKARSNIAWQARKSMGLTPNAPIRLVGTITARALG